MKIPLMNHIFLAMVLVISLNIQPCNANQGNLTMPATVTVKVVETDARQRRSMDQFPDQLDVDLSTDEFHEQFQSLKRNYHVPDIQYVHMMENGAIKTFKFESKQNSAYYIDVEHGAAFRVSLASEGSEDFDIYGTFVSGQHEYLVQPTRDNRSTYTVSLIEEKLTTSFDYISLSDTDANIIEEKMQNHSEKTMTGREKRQTTDYEVEIFFVHDFAMYNSWYATTEGENDRHSATVTKMIQFTAFLLNAIDLRYQTVTDYSYTISCLFAGIYIADVSSDAPFVEDHVSNNQAVAETVLSAFKEWGEDSLGDFNFDHAMLFTGYDIGETIDGVFISDIAGLAYLPSYNTNGELFNAAVCGTLRYSINEGGNFEPTMATIGAHELGHNLGSSHDGSSNNCSGGYVMEPSLEVSRNASENLELWQFSSCSQTYFDTYITDLNDASLNCMTVKTATDNDDLDPYVNDLAGQLYSPDVQCERIRGSGSFLYRSKYDGNYSTICQSMACASTTTSGSFYYYIPWEGTTCGNGKVCQSGHCVESPLAPPVDNETCLFGDVPYNMPFQTSGCYDFLGTLETSYNCYHEPYRLHCCETCEAIRQNNTAYVDCEYGDKVTGCSEISLYSCRSNSELCCRRCQDIQLDIPGCPWGDLYSNCAELSCSANSEECCQTCASSTTISITIAPTTTTDTITTTTKTPTTTISPSTTTTITSTTTTSTPLTTAATSTTLTDSSTATATIYPTATITVSLTTADTTSTTITPTATTSSSTTSVSPTPTSTSSPMEAISSRVQVSPTLLFCFFLYQFNKLFG